MLFSPSVMSKSLLPYELQHARLPCPSSSPGACANSCLLSWWYLQTISLCWSLLLLPSIFPTIRIFSNESDLHIRWPEYWSFSFSISISPSNEYSGLISFRIDLFDPWSPRDSQESSPKPQFKSISSLVLSFLYGPTLTSICDLWKNHRFDYDTCDTTAEGSIKIS